MEIFHRFTDLVEPVSIDEAFLDVTGSARALGDGRGDRAASSRTAIRDETQLTASVGVATSKLVAKIASDMRKPDGLVVVPPGTEAAFLAPLPVRRLWGVGPKMEEALAKLGVVTIGDLAALDPGAPRAAARDARPRPAAARPRRGRPRRGRGGGGGEEPRPGAHLRPGHRRRRAAAGDAPRSSPTASPARLRAHGLRARTVTLKYRDEDFHTTTHARTLDGADRRRQRRSSAWPRSSSPRCTAGRRCASSGSTPRTSARRSPSSASSTSRRRPRRSTACATRSRSASGTRRSPARASSAAASAATPPTSRRAEAIAAGWGRGYLWTSTSGREPPLASMYFETPAGTDHHARLVLVQALRVVEQAARL